MLQVEGGGIWTGDEIFQDVPGSRSYTSKSHSEMFGQVMVCMLCIKQKPSQLVANAQANLSLSRLSHIE